MPGSSKYKDLMKIRARGFWKQEMSSVCMTFLPRWGYIYSQQGVPHRSLLALPVFCLKLPHLSAGFPFFSLSTTTCWSRLKFHFFSIKDWRLEEPTISCIVEYYEHTRSLRSTFLVPNVHPALSWPAAHRLDQGMVHHYKLVPFTRRNITFKFTSSSFTRLR